MKIQHFLNTADQIFVGGGVPEKYCVQVFKIENYFMGQNAKA